MSLMQDTQNIKKTDEQVYLITLVRQSADRPMYLDHMVYQTTAAGQRFMANLADAFDKAGYRKEKTNADHYELNNGLDKITLTGKSQSVFQG
ncbi:MAG TPA: hypothetical protein H9721_01690 [Candidatus Limosilactobacillus intestinipullorum]|nr:hypothetical protein [Candidatus Limosilactobacillus intestinipullorum]